ISLLVLTVIGIESGCNGSQNQLGENNNDLSISQVHTSFLFRFLTRFFIDINKLYNFIFNSLGYFVSKR
ncbi:hypothetical protein ACFVIJ_15410, partial [Heyndrickxia sporothermodurans]